MNTCKTCKHWLFDEDEMPFDQICSPIDPDTCEPMVMPFEVRECSCPALVKFERPSQKNGFAVSDGSNYQARLCTARDFGCVLHESRGGAGEVVEEGGLALTTESANTILKLIEIAYDEGMMPDNLDPILCAIAAQDRQLVSDCPHLPWPRLTAILPP